MFQFLLLMLLIGFAISFVWALFGDFVFPRKLRWTKPVAAFFAVLIGCQGVELQNRLELVVSETYPLVIEGGNYYADLGDGTLEWVPSGMAQSADRAYLVQDITWSVSLVKGEVPSVLKETFQSRSWVCRHLTCPVGTEYTLTLVVEEQKEDTR